MTVGVCVERSVELVVGTVGGGEGGRGVRAAGRRRTRAERLAFMMEDAKVRRAGGAGEAGGEVAGDGAQVW